jgi:hypothetical protein
MSVEGVFWSGGPRPGRASEGGTGGASSSEEEIASHDRLSGAPERVPKEVIDQAKAAFARRTTGEVAVLAWDSLVDEYDRAEDHRLVFEHSDLQIEVRILAAERSWVLQGRVNPPAQLHVELESEHGDVLGIVEALAGDFVLQQVPPGMVRLSIRDGRSREVHTDWFRI